MSIIDPSATASGTSLGRGPVRPHGGRAQTSGGRACEPGSHSSLLPPALPPWVCGTCAPTRMHTHTCVGAHATYMCAGGAHVHSTHHARHTHHPWTHVCCTRHRCMCRVVCCPATRGPGFLRPVQPGPQDLSAAVSGLGGAPVGGGPSSCAWGGRHVSRPRADSQYLGTGAWFPDSEVVIDHGAWGLPRIPCVLTGQADSS